MIRFQIVRFLNWLIDIVSPLPDFGPLGVLRLDPATGEYQPMEEWDLSTLAVEGSTDFWAEHEQRALCLYGPSVLKEN